MNAKTITKTADTVVAVGAVVLVIAGLLGTYTDKQQNLHALMDRESLLIHDINRECLADGLPETVCDDYIASLAVKLAYWEKRDG